MRPTCQRARVAAFLFILPLLSAAAACDEAPTTPSASAVAVIQVSGETFRVRLTTPAQIRAAELARDGGTAKIPIGRIVMGTEVNVGWSWHLEEVSFAEVTIELCDGRPSMVEREGTRFGNGWFCPWGARVVSVH